MPRLSAREQARRLERLRAICLALPDTTEKLSHGEATFFHKRRSFLSLDTYHHGEDRFAAWIAAPLGAQDTLVRSDPERFFVPPYVGHRGWVGVRLDRDPDWDEIARLVADARALVARKR